MSCTMRRVMHLLGKYVLCFIAVIAVFVASMTLVYMIPNQKIEWHREYSLYTLMHIEETWESFGNLFGLHSTPGMMDNSSDRVMMRDALSADESMSALEAAMYMNGYSRYWHGYQVFLRPMLVLYQLHQIRYLNMFVFFGMLVCVLSALKKRTGVLSAAAFFMTMACAHIVVIPMSMQYMAVFMVTMAAMLLILWRYPFKKPENLPLFFMVVGMTINFLDLLTAPVVTLGIPLILCLYLQQEEGADALRAIKTAVGCSVSWAAGYGLCWVTKWVLSSAILKKSLADDVNGKVQFWLMNTDHAESRLGAVLRNFEDYFTVLGIRTMVFPLLLLLLLFAALLFCVRRSKQRWALSGVMLAVSAYPYIWYFLLAEHSWQHHWFTYRAQAVTLFGVYMAVLALIDREKMNGRLQKLRRAAGIG